MYLMEGVALLTSGGLLDGCVSFCKNTFTEVDDDRPCLSVTVNLNVNVVSTVTDGAVNVALTVLAPFNVKVGEPAVCPHMKDAILSPGSGSSTCASVQGNQCTFSYGLGW